MLNFFPNNNFLFIITIRTTKSWTTKRSASRHHCGIWTRRATTVDVQVSPPPYPPLVPAPLDRSYRPANRNGGKEAATITITSIVMNSISDFLRFSHSFLFPSFQLIIRMSFKNRCMISLIAF